MWDIEVIRLLYYLPMERMKVKYVIDGKDYVTLPAYEILEKKYNQLEEENKKLKSDLAFERTMLDNVRAEYKSLQNVIKKLKDRIDVLYEFIERNDKLVDEVIDEEDLDKLNRYIYIDDDLVDRALESED